MPLVHLRTMQTTREQLNPTTVKLTIVADPAILSEAKQAALRQLARTMKLPGFRSGKAPLGMVERSADPGALQTEVLDTALSRLYAAALDAEQLRPVDQPKVTLSKFVPFSTLEFTAEVQVIAIRPDGSTEPLIWLRRVNSSAPDTYWFRSRISLPARTQVRTIPPAASATLLVQ